MRASGAAQIVDVLPSHEYDAAHIRGAIHIPLRNLLRDAPATLDRARPVVVYCRDCLCDLSARAAAQLELVGYTDVRHYFRGKADWIVRGMPTDPSAPLPERIRAFPYFINNLAPGLRSFWIHYTDRVRVAEFMHDDLIHLGPEDAVASAAPDSRMPRAVVLNADGILLGAIEAIQLRPARARRDESRAANNPPRHDAPPRREIAEVESLLADNNRNGQIHRALCPDLGYLSITPSPEISR